jgi:hypothetical protein
MLRGGRLLGRIRVVSLRISFAVVGAVAEKLSESVC